MSILILQADHNTPYVNFDSETGILELNGRLIPESALLFFEPLVQWLKNHVTTMSTKTELHLSIEYLSTTSSKYLLDLIRQMEKLQDAGKQVGIFWYHEPEDEDMMDSGEDFKSLVKCRPFQIVEVPGIFDRPSLHRPQRNS